VSAVTIPAPDVTTFAQLAEQAGCRVAHCREADLEQAGWWEQMLAGAGQEAAVADLPVGAMSGIAVAQSLHARFAGADRLLRRQGAICTGDPALLLGCQVGVSDCALAVAETGSLLLVGAEPADRLVWLLPPRSVLLVETDNVVPSLDEAMAWLQAHTEAGAATLVTGPSRTSDVERVLTIGVQGPREVIVVLVDEAED
jgi:hypothetical protein